MPPHLVAGIQDSTDRMLNTAFAPWPSFSEEEVQAVAEVLASNRVNYWTGDECRRFEIEFARSWSYGTRTADLTLFPPSTDFGTRRRTAVILPFRRLRCFSGEKPCALSKLLASSSPCLPLVPPGRIPRIWAADCQERYRLSCRQMVAR